MFIQLFVIFLSLYHVKSADLWVFDSNDSYTSTPLKSPLGLLNSSFNVTLDTVFFAFGFNSTPSTVTTIAITKAYMELKQNTDMNYVLLNWEKEASTEIAGPIIHYPTTGIYNAKRIGEDLGDALLELSNHGLDLKRVHLMGHSLGSHLMGHAGKQTTKQQKPVGRITGLDPAGPLYDSPTLLHPLRETDAIFVVGIHSDPVVYGTSENVGHVDIWLNCGMRHQPGCRENSLELCSHARAPYCYAESINSIQAFPAAKSTSCGDWKATKNINDEDEIIYMGENIDRNATGIFYLRTNSARPFGKGLDGIQYS
ncbi:unnamed protein product [Pieris macdunnoughi]|uniref:Lipase domain-containing protein n=1 Tax=Pieris macdunnoughi TaxID=345717 RepID=A0A821RZW5_9NEOP|nr:unnamed protein product [Pieris macdunnoughi]